MASSSVILIFSVVLFQNVHSVKDQITINRENELKQLINWEVEPCDNFYKFACGNYETLYPMPPYRGKFETLDRWTETNYVDLDRLLRENIGVVLQREPVTAEEKAKAFYSLCNNMTELNLQSIISLDELFTILGGFPAISRDWENTNFNWHDLITFIHSIFYKNPFFVEAIALRDPMKVTNRSVPQFHTVSAGVPDIRSSMDESESDKQKLRLILKEFGLNETMVNRTFHEYYKLYGNLKELENVTSSTAKTATIKEFDTLVPGFNWSAFLHGVYGVQFSGVDLIFVSNVEYFQNLVNFLNKSKAFEIANFAILNLIDDLLPVLDIGFLNIRDKYNEATQGYETPIPRWRQCIDLVLDVMNHPTAAIFIKGMNLPNNRDNVQQMLDNVKSVFTKFLRNSAWPGPNTKHRTIEKLNGIRLDFSWENLINDPAAMDIQYGNLHINKSNFLETYITAKRITNRRISKLYAQDSNNFWYYPLVSAEAFMVHEFMKFSIHPGLIKPPFYHNKFPKFLQFGNLGVVVSHEISHSFDNMGSGYNAQGLLENWWSDTDYVEFENRTKCFVDQYDNYTLYGKSLKDRQYNFENIADSSGIRFAYMAYDEFLESNPQTTEETVQGMNLTSKQLFFVSMAQFFCAPVKPEAAEHFIKTDPHATGPYRVIGMVQNSEDFSRNFNCPVDSAMNPSTKCNIYS